MNMKKMLENKTLRELIDLYEFDILEVYEDGVLLDDKQLDEQKIFTKDFLIYYFTVDCENRYSQDGNIFHMNQANELKSLLN